MRISKTFFLVVTIIGFSFFLFSINHNGDKVEQKNTIKVVNELEELILENIDDGENNVSLNTEGDLKHLLTEKKKSLLEEAESNPGVLKENLISEEIRNNLPEELKSLVVEEREITGIDIHYILQYLEEKNLQLKLLEM